MILINYLIYTLADDNVRVTDASQERAITSNLFKRQYFFSQHERGVLATIKTVTKIVQNVFCNKEV